MEDKKNTKRDRESQKKKLAVCEIALVLFHKYGYQHTSIADISKASGMSSGSIYHHFGSKEGILQTILQQFGEVTITHDNWDEKIADPYGTIMAFLLDYADYWENIGADLLAHMTTPFENEYSDASGKFSDKLKGYSDFIEFISACQDAGTISKDMTARDIAFSMIYIGRCMVFDWSHFKGGYGLHHTVETIMPGIIRSYLI